MFCHACFPKTPGNFRFYWKCKGLKLTHLFFLLIMCFSFLVGTVSPTHIMSSIDIFLFISGLKPSGSKSLVFFSDCNLGDIDWFSCTYGIPIGELLVMFLGVPFISSKLSIDNCIPLIVKIRARIFSCIVILLSLAGRVQLVGAVLFSIQLYWTNHFLLPEAVHNRIKSICIRFIWKGDITKMEEHV